MSPGRLPVGTLPGRAKPPVSIYPLLVLITRISPGRFDRDDGVNISCKHVRDGVADAIGVDDDDARVTWRYAQEKCAKGENGARVEIFLRMECPCCGSEVAKMNPEFAKMKPEEKESV